VGLEARSLDPARQRRPILFSVAPACLSPDAPCATVSDCKQKKMPARAGLTIANFHPDTPLFLSTKRNLLEICFRLALSNRRPIVNRFVTRRVGHRHTHLSRRAPKTVLLGLQRRAAMRHPVRLVLLCVVLLATCFQESKATCPSGWFPSDSSSTPSACYKRVNHDAWQYGADYSGDDWYYSSGCSNTGLGGLSGATLATFVTTAEYNAMVSHITTLFSGVWDWRASGAGSLSLAKFTTGSGSLWGPNEPSGYWFQNNNMEEHCVEVVSDGPYLNDYPCVGGLSAVCVLRDHIPGDPLCFLFRRPAR
jgi:hypothetical protein